MLFAIDQQQYLQGYLPVVFAMLFVNNLNTVGDGAARADRAGDHQQGERGQGGRARREGHALGPSAGWAAMAPPTPRRKEPRPMTDVAVRPDARRTARPRQPARDARRAAGHRRARRRGRRLLPVRLLRARRRLARRPRDREPVDRPGRAVRDRRRPGRAADDRRRVRPLGRRHDRQLGPPARRADDARATSTSGRRSWSCCCSAMAIGFINGVHGRAGRGCRASSSRSGRSSSSRA